MTSHVLVSGTIFHAPEQRISKAGKPFVTTTLKVADGNTVQWWRVTVFSETTMNELLRLGEGDAVAVQGALRAETYMTDAGEIKLSLGVIADHVLALRAEKRKKARDAPSRPKTEPVAEQVKGRPSRRERCAGAWSGPADGPSDPLPF